MSFVLIILCGCRDVTYVTASGSIVAAAGHNSSGVNVVVWDTLAPPATSRASIMCHEGLLSLYLWGPIYEIFENAYSSRGARKTETINEIVFNPYCDMREKCSSAGLN